MGAMGYADDLLLPAPSRTAMQMMFQACEEFGTSNNLLFSTDPGQLKSKTKCVFICGKKKLDKPVPMCIYRRELPWGSTATHLAGELSEDGTMDTDIKFKNAAFIISSLEVREQFSFAPPMEVLKAVRAYYCGAWRGGGHV